MHHSRSSNLQRILQISVFSLGLAYGLPVGAQSNAAAQGGVVAEPAASQNPVPSSGQLSPPQPVYPVSLDASGSAVAAPVPGVTVSTTAPSASAVPAPGYAGASPAPAAVAPSPAPTAAPLAAPVDPERARKLAELRERRAKVSMGLPIGLSAAGVALLAVAASAGVEALLYSNAGNCEGYNGAPDCLDRGFVWGFAGASIGAGVIGIALLSVGLPKLFHAFGERRALRQEMRSVSLKQPSFALDLGQHRAGLTLRARY